MYHRSENIKSLFRKASKEMMADYSKRVGFLKGLRMADQLVRIYSHIIYLTSKTYFYQSLQPTVPEKVAAAQLLPHSSTSEGSDIATEIQQKTRSKYNNELRDQLFQLDKGSVIFLQLKSVIYFKTLNVQLTESAKEQLDSRRLETISMPS
jgi:hypothetical protein